MTVMPEFIPDRPYMAGAFLSCVLWAGGDEAIVARFEKETQQSLTSILRARGLDAEIDKATGHQAKVISGFADWVATNLWGAEPTEP